MNWRNQKECSNNLADRAVSALTEEAELTPKPALVDKRSTGAHQDIDFNLMMLSAKSLRKTFAEIASVSYQREPSQPVREEIAAIGRHGEKVMLKATGGTNTHKGAIWSLGLLVSSAAMGNKNTSLEEIVLDAGEIARFQDRHYLNKSTNGIRVEQRFGVRGARQEAEQGFPHLFHFAIPALWESRLNGETEEEARLNALTALIARLDDTCLLHRGGTEALTTAKRLADSVLLAGGVSTEKGWRLFNELDAELLDFNASPGGSADLLAAALFVDGLYGR